MIRLFALELLHFIFERSVDVTILFYTLILRRTLTLKRSDANKCRIQLLLQQLEILLEFVFLVHQSKEFCTELNIL